MSNEVKKKRKLKRWVYNVLFAIAGAVIGEVVAFLTQNIPFLKWLAFEVPLGITTPLDLNFIIFRFQIGFYFVFCPALVLFIVLALVIGNLIVSEQTSKSPSGSSKGSTANTISRVTVGDLEVSQQEAVSEAEEEESVAPDTDSVSDDR